MSTRTRAAACAVLAAVVLPVAAAGPAQGQDLPRTAVVAAQESDAALAAAAAGAREQVRRIALSGLPAELRTSAWNALRSTRGDAAIAEWLAPGGGYDLAKQRLRDTRTRNRQFCERVVATHPASFAPATRAGAEKALKGTDADRAAFVRSGYAQAQAKDRGAREAAGTEQQAVRAKDREFVATLAAHDPGEQVRVAAQWALRTGAGDEDVREFYGFGWVSGGALDLEGHRLRTAESEALRHRHADAAAQGRGGRRGGAARRLGRCRGPRGGRTRLAGRGRPRTGRRDGLAGGAGARRETGGNLEGGAGPGPGRGGRVVEAAGRPRGRERAVLVPGGAGRSGLRRLLAGHPPPGPRGRDPGGGLTTATR
ncbi:hypothetical protein LUR56_38535 [Streptomyces sp. MT29]|nr:hypothetical protein [Streptomyces sp. MT29]